MTDDADIARKIEQAAFHLDALRAATASAAAEAHFAAFMGAARSAVMYVQKIGTSWTKINAWERRLPAEDLDGWRVVVDLRNLDTHETPIAPDLKWHDWFGGYMGDWLGDRPTHTVELPDGRQFDAVKLAETALRVVRRLLAEHRAL